MAEENTEDQGAGGAGEESECPPCPKCEVCVPGLPGWMATFSDLVTLLLTFFVLLLSFAKTESAKYEAALGSIRNAFGGNVLQQGEVLQPGKSPDNSPEMMDAQDPVRPFPIEFLTMEGLLDKKEINRESEETLQDMKNTLKDESLSENVDIYEMPEGIKARVKDKILFQKNSLAVADDGVAIEVLDKMVKLLVSNKWTLYVEGHASKGEIGPNGMDAFTLSARRAEAVTRQFIQKGVRPDRITTLFYGDTRMDSAFEQATNPEQYNRRVEFVLRKRDLRDRGNKVDSQ